MLGESSLLGSSGKIAAVAGAHEHGDGVWPNNNSGEEDKASIGEEGDRSFGGNRWPREETLALLKIRSDMDVAFRDANVKGPLWENVSRKLAELGYHRCAKKCKEKFENLYKYHKRTKEGRGGKSDGKTYRFFEQLEALENHQNLHLSPQQPKPPQNIPVVANSFNLPNLSSHISIVPSPSTIHPPSNSMSRNITPIINLTIPSLPPANPRVLLPMQPPVMNQPFFPSSLPNMPTDILSNSSSSTYSEEETADGQPKRKRKWKDFFQRLMKEVINKQEELEKRFLEAIEKREHDRIAREEAWRMQEMTRIDKEREILAQERSVAATKDAAVISFLQKVSEQQNPPGQPENNLPPPPLPQPTPPPVQQLSPPPPLSSPTLPVVNTNLDGSKLENGETYVGAASSSRWPKVEIQALIQLRTNLDSKYQDSGSKGPLWEEISNGMRKLGYNRSSKRCKEKWENINKYFKKVKESNKKRPKDSKTCPYFHQLDALYREKTKIMDNSSSNQLKRGQNTIMAAPAAPVMVPPEQQWPPPPPPQEHQADSSMMDDTETNQMDQNQQDLEDDDNDNKDGGDEDEDEGGDEYELVASKPSSMGTTYV